jgi:hypothetical protein
LLTANWMFVIQRSTRIIAQENIGQAVTVICLIVSFWPARLSPVLSRNYQHFSLSVSGRKQFSIVDRICWPTGGPEDRWGSCP